MGYPMSYRRVVNRNGLAVGGYDDKTPPKVGSVPFPPREKFDQTIVTEERYVEVLHEELERRRGVIEANANGRRMLLGDLRRLEADSVDERATCATIANKTGIDPEIVAAVLKEFLAW